MFQSIALNLLLAVADQKEPTSTLLLAEQIGATQQRVESLLKEMEQDGLIKRQPFVNDMRLTMTGKGRMALLDFQDRIQKALRCEKQLTGKLITGLGQGKYYISMQAYQQPIETFLGKEPYPGTLNIAVDPAAEQLFVKELKGETIAGFTANGKTYGGITLYPVRIAEHPCLLLIPERRKEVTKAEIVAAVHLRSALDLSDGDSVTIEKR